MKERAKSEKETKGAYILFRVSPAHKLALQEFAASQGLDFSSWMRQLALRSAGLLPGSKRSRSRVFPLPKTTEHITEDGR